MGVIDDYLVAVAASIGDRRDRNDILAETEDHLRTASEQLVIDGAGLDAAEVEAVRRLGDPTIFGRSMAEIGGGVAVQTEVTRKTGAVAALGAPLWLAYPVLGFLADRADQGQDWEGTPRTLYMIGASLLLFAGVTTMIGAIGLAQRHGGLGRIGTGAPLAPYGLTLFIMVGAAWAEALWLALLGVTLALLVPTLWRRHLVSRPAIAAIAAAVPVAAISITALHAVAFGPVDSFGDRNQAFALGTGIGMAVLAIGVAAIGRWLWSEQAVEIEERGHIRLV